MTEFERIIKEAVLKKNFTISEFCAEVNLSRQGFYNLCKGVNLPTEETLNKINTFLGIDFISATKRRSKPSGAHTGNVQKDKVFEVR